LQNGGTGSIQLVVCMQEEENVKRLFQNWVRSIIFLAKVIHLIQETKIIHSDLMPLIIRNDLRSGVTQTIRGYNKIATLANTVGHALGRVSDSFADFI